VEDDAGGLDLAKLAPGRGLDRLQQELGPDRLQFIHTHLRDLFTPTGAWIPTPAY
jgi:hypothetical protein